MSHHSQETKKDEHHSSHRHNTHSMSIRRISTPSTSPPYPYQYEEDAHVAASNGEVEHSKHDSMEVDMVRSTIEPEVMHAVTGHAGSLGQPTADEYYGYFKQHTPESY